MPIYRGIKLKLHTPFSIQGLPEIALTENISHCSPAKHFGDESQSSVSVFVPIVPQAHFWISYNVEEPPTEPGVFYVFKLLINGQPIVTWCCGEEENWKGKTMFSLHDSEQHNVVGGAGMEKRFFHFSKKKDEASGEEGPDKQMFCHNTEHEHCVEVRVCRANVKIRTSRELQKCKGLPRSCGIELRPGGITKRGFPKTFFKFGLLDPMDNPHATFRFYYRTVDELEVLGLEMEKLNVKQTEPLSNASPGSARSEGSDKHWVAPSKIPRIKLERSKCGSISEQYFSYPSCAPGKKKRASTTVDGSPQKNRFEDSSQWSPERGRRPAPKGPRRNNSIRTSGPWVPPMPNTPLLPPPVPEQRTNVWQFATLTESPEIMETACEEPKINPKRLSVPPSIVLRPLLTHGALDTSPKKIGRVVESQPPLREKALPPSPRRRARAETGGMLKIVMANAVRRRNLTNPESRGDGSTARE